MTEARLTVLLIESEDEHASAFAESLARQTSLSEVDVARSVADAFERLEELSHSGAPAPFFDAVAVNLSTCEQPALSVIEQLRQILSGAPIVALAPSGDADLRDEVLRAGADEVAVATSGYGTNLATLVRLTVEKHRLRAEIQLQRHQLLELASRDELTDLANRRRFNETLDLEVERAVRFHRALTLLLIDLDGLKAINDGRGHLAGDAAIRHVGSCLRSEIRRFEVAARIGGDEFAVLLVDTNFDAGRLVAEKLRKRIADAPLAAAGAVTVSAGLASLPAHAATSSDLVRLADEALYEAKNTGRNRVVLCRQLRAERDGDRHPVRFKILVAGRSRQGEDFSEEAETELISRRGARVLASRTVETGEQLTLRTPFHQTPLTARVTSCYRGADNRWRVGFKLVDPPRWGADQPMRSAKPG